MIAQSQMTILPRHISRNILPPQNKQTITTTKKNIIRSRTISSKHIKHLFLFPCIKYTRGHPNRYKWLEKLPLYRRIWANQCRKDKKRTPLGKSVQENHYFAMMGTFTVAGCGCHHLNLLMHLRKNLYCWKYYTRYMSPPPPPIDLF